MPCLRYFAAAVIAYVESAANVMTADLSSRMLLASLPVNVMWLMVAACCRVFGIMLLLWWRLWNRRKTC
jgi:hypothetical protein